MSFPGRLYAVGLTTCLGRTHGETLTAYQAGKKAFERPPGIVGPDGTPPTLAQAIPLIEEFDLLPRFARLFGQALDDLDAQVPQAAPSAAALFLLLPQWLRESRMGPTVTRRAESTGRLPAQVLRFYDDETTFPELVAHAVAQAGRAPVLVGVVDSFIHAELLDALAIQGRLLTRATPNGIIPSEAAAIFLVGEGAGAPVPEPAGLLVQVEVARESVDRRRPMGLFGRALADLWRRVGARLPPDRLLIDMDGERWRGEELGTAISAADLPDALAADPETPPLTLGFTGCAGPAVAMALALGAAPRSVANRQGAAGECCHVSHSWPDGRRVLAVVQRPVRPDETAAAPADPVSTHSRGIS